MAEARSPLSTTAHGASAAKPQGSLGELPRPALLGAVTTTGELGRRIALSFGRLERYDSQDCYSGNAGWPADREGRVILAQALIGRANGTQAVHIDGLVAELPGRLNTRGYMGEALPADLHDEQYLSGHSWLLRGLIEYQLWRQDATSRALIQSIVDGLLLPCLGSYQRYPLGMSGRVRFGEVAGTLTSGIVDGWRLSTDIGCAFIMLDGATAAWEICPSPPLRALIVEMIARFKVFDPVATSAQTHATLSALRGLLRWSRLTGDAADVAFIVERYSLYVSQALTDNFGNWNWFGRPLWTEPCAMVDALEVGYQLWAITGETRYLDDVDAVLHNGLAYGQRPNGGFGCDNCVGGDGTVTLKPFLKAYEGPWCCTMRGAVGLARAASYGWAVGRDDGVSMPLLHASRATLTLTDATVTLERSGDYPLEGVITVSVRGCVATHAASAPAALRLRAYLPSWAPATGVTLTIDGRAQPIQVVQGMVVWSMPARVGVQAQLEIPMRIRRVPPVTAALKASHVAFRHGPLVLSMATGGAVAVPEAGFESLGKGRYRLIDGRELGPVTAVTFADEASARADQRCVLFHY